VIEMETILIFMFGFFVGEIITGFIILGYKFSLNKERFGVYIVPKTIKEKYGKLIKEELKNLKQR